MPVFITNGPEVLGQIGQVHPRTRVAEVAGDEFAHATLPTCHRCPGPGDRPACPPWGCGPAPGSRSSPSRSHGGRSEDSGGGGQAVPRPHRRKKPRGVPGRAPAGSGRWPRARPTGGEAAHLGRPLSRPPRRWRTSTSTAQRCAGTVAHLGRPRVRGRSGERGLPWVPRARHRPVHPAPRPLVLAAGRRRRIATSPSRPRRPTRSSIWCRPRYERGLEATLGSVGDGLPCQVVE